MNLFANIEKFSTDDSNYSFGELEADNGNEDVVELPEDIIPKTVATKRTRSNKGRSAKKSKSNKIPDDVFDCSDVCIPDNEVSVNPGLGQKTAVKKLTKLKQSLASAAVKNTINTRSRTSFNQSIRETLQRNRAKRASLSQTSQIETKYTIDNTPAAIVLEQNNVANDSFDDEDLSLYIKIKWEGTSKIERIQFSLYKKFSELIGELSTREKIDAKLFLLMLGNNVIKPDDSPHSIGYTLGKFISVRVVDNPNLYIGQSSSSQSSNTIEVKIQSPKWKKPLICNIKLTEPFKVLTGMCSEKLQCHPNKLRFKFDGEIIDTTSTPDDLELEGGEILDLIMSD